MNRPSARRGALALPLLLAAQAARAFTAADAGTAGARFLLLPGDARVAAAGQVCAAAEGATAAFCNPAGLAGAASGEFAFAHDEHLGLFRDETAAYAAKAPGGVLAGSLQLMTQDAIQKVDNTGRTLGDSFHPSDAAAGLAWGGALGRWNAGAGLRVLRQSLESDSAVGALADLGAATRVGSLELGGAALHLGPGVRFRSHTDPLPTTLLVSAAWREGKQGFAAAQADFPADDQPTLKLGGEWAWPAGEDFRIALRGGFRTQPVGGLGLLSGFTFGTGLERGPWSLDFAFTPYGALGNSYLIGLRRRL